MVHSILHEFAEKQKYDMSKICDATTYNGRYGGQQIVKTKYDDKEE